MFISDQDDMIISKCIDIARSKGTLTSHDIAKEMGLAREPSNNPVIVDATKPQLEVFMRNAIYKSMEWLRNYNRAFKKGEPSTEYTMTVTDNLTINADSASIVGVDSSNVASSTGYSFTIHNPSITQDIINDLTKPSKDSHLTIDFGCGNLEDEVNKKLFSTKNFNLPIRPLRYWQTDNGCITVEWTDNTKTTVTPSDPKHADLFSGICIAYAKKMFGSTTAIMKSIKQAKWLTDAPKRNKELARKLDKVNRERKQKRAKEHREAMIERRVEAIKVEHEAKKRIAEEKGASNNV